MPITRSLSSQTTVRKGDAPLLFQTAEQVLKMGNPYHDSGGQFTSKEKASAGGADGGVSDLESMLDSNDAMSGTFDLLSGTYKLTPEEIWGNKELVSALVKGLKTMDHDSGDVPEAIDKVFSAALDAKIKSRQNK